MPRYQPTKMWCAYVALSLCVTLVAAYPDGPPVDTDPAICESMEPFHYTEPSTLEPYFEFVMTPNCEGESPEISATLKVIDSAMEDDTKTFKGVFIQARIPGDSSMSYGVFSTTESDIGPLDCFGETANALGQTDSGNLKSIDFSWTPPADLTDDIEFVATIVHNFGIYWRDIKSDFIYPNFCPPVQSECSWTEWIDRDNPGGSGDWETLAGHKKAGLVPMAAEPEDVECASLNESGAAEVYSCTLDGLVCKNDDQVDCFCQDYKVRYCINAGEVVDCDALKNKKEKKKCKKAAKSASADPCEGLKKKKKKACEKEQEPCFYLKKKQLKKCEKEEAVEEWVDPCKGKKGKAKKKCQKSACQPMDL